MKASILEKTLTAKVIVFRNQWYVFMDIGGCYCIDLDKYRVESEKAKTSAWNLSTMKRDVNNILCSIPRTKSAKSTVRVTTVF